MTETVFLLATLAALLAVKCVALIAVNSGRFGDLPRPPSQID